jgi:alpha-ketoglutarate-dependent taurine dioxygenase
MSLHFHPLFPDFGARIEGLDPSTYSDPETVKILREAIGRYKLVLIQRPDLETDDHVGFAEILGSVARRGVAIKAGQTHSFISNEIDGAQLPEGELYFHSDQVYFDPPLKAITLYAMSIPGSGGDTKFTDAGLAYERLPASLKERIQGLHAFHAHDYSGNKYAKETRGVIDLTRDDAVSATHPVVWEHPETKRPILLVNRSQTQYIVGMERDESDALLHELYRHIEDPAHVYSHKWTVGDLLVWDNWSLQHARTEWDAKEPRTLRRVPIIDTQTADAI